MAQLDIQVGNVSLTPKNNNSECTSNIVRQIQVPSDVDSHQIKSIYRPRLLSHFPFIYKVH